MSACVAVVFLQVVPFWVVARILQGYSLSIARESCTQYVAGAIRALLCHNGRHFASKGTPERNTMIRELIHDDEILGKRCEVATAEDAPLAQDLLDTLESIEDGGCIAANQIGVTKAVIAYKDDNGKAHVMFNPKILLGLRAQKTQEGCLSREEVVKVTRYAKVKVQFEELNGDVLVQRKRDFMGWTAQMIQHMVDHCNGKLV